MNQDYWQRQTTDPLFPNLIWSRPETIMGAGKLLIIGGQAQEFINVAECFAVAEKAGAGSIRVFLPDSTRKITKLLPNIEYAPANTSGSFAREALAELLDAGLWADGVLLAGDLGKNSETSLMLESFIDNYSGLLIISQEALPSLSIATTQLVKRDNTILIINQPQLQKFGIELAFEKPVTSTTGLVDLAAILHEMSTLYAAKIAVSNNQTIWTASSGRVALTTSKTAKTVSTLSAQVSVWAIQNPTKLYEALATAAYC